MPKKRTLVKRKVKKVLKGENIIKVLIALCTLALIATSVLPYILR